MSRPPNPPPSIPDANDAPAPGSIGAEPEAPTRALDRAEIAKLLAACEEPATTPLLASLPLVTSSLLELVAQMPPPLPDDARLPASVGSRRRQSRPPERRPAAASSTAPRIPQSAVRTERLGKGWRADEALGRGLRLRLFAEDFDRANMTPARTLARSARADGWPSPTLCLVLGAAALIASFVNLWSLWHAQRGAESPRTARDERCAPAAASAPTHSSAAGHPAGTRYAMPAPPTRERGDPR